jgi:hypothetical protein
MTSWEKWGERGGSWNSKVWGTCLLHQWSPCHCPTRLCLRTLEDPLEIVNPLKDTVIRQEQTWRNQKLEFKNKEAKKKELKWQPQVFKEIPPLQKPKIKKNKNHWGHQ